MTRAALAQPDVTLLLDMTGVIREATVSHLLSDESVDSWLGASWIDTVADFVGEKVRRIVEDARDTGISAFRQLTQRFPSGREVPMEYTTVLLGGRAGLLAVGKSLLAVADLQSRFVAAQQAMERDYWKLREVETRYRLLFDHSTEAVLLVRPGDLTIEDSNPAAVQAFGLSGHGRKALLDAVPVQEQDALRALLQRAQEQSRPPALSLHLGDGRQPWTARASAVKGDAGTMLLIQLVPVGSRPPAGRPDALPSATEILAGLADALVLIDAHGVVQQCNQAFADLVDVPSTAAIAGESLHRWLWRPGADLPFLLSALRSHGTVRLFPSAIHGDLNGETEVELSGTTLAADGDAFYALVIRAVGRRPARLQDAERMDDLIGSVAEPVGKMPLKQLIRSTVDGVERHYIRAALEHVDGNRSAAAELLGVSRQSLYTKLGRYGLDKDVAPEPAGEA